MASQGLVRPPLRCTRQVPWKLSRVFIYHPAYDQANALLFTLDCNDAPLAADGSFSNNAGRPTIPQGLVHAACAIVANNSFNGWLATSRLPSEAYRLNSSDPALGPGHYFFHVPFPNGVRPGSLEDTYKYPVVANFRSWQVPHGEALQSVMGGAWSSALNHFSGSKRTQGCVISDTELGCHNAHIIPSYEYDWFRMNEVSMEVPLASAGSTTSINSPGNVIRIRADLHGLWDNKQFTFVPKENAFVVHCLISDEELVSTWHNRSLQDLKGVPPAILFARFAWSLFPLRLFLQPSAARLLVVAEEASDVLGTREVDSRTELDQLMDKPRSTSPRKRKPPSPSPGRHGVASNEISEYFYGPWENHTLRRHTETGQAEADDPPRGRKRARVA